MSEAEMKGIRKEMTEDLQAILRYVEIKQNGLLDDLRGIIIGAFGHCDDTARQRVNYLISSRAIIPFGKQWKFNKSGFENHQNEIKTLLALRDAGVIQDELRDTIEEPKDKYAETLDKANRERYCAKQE